MSYPSVEPEATQSRFAANASSSLYPEIRDEGAMAPPAAFEEVLVSIPGAMVHLVDAVESVLLGSGEFSVVKISQSQDDQLQGVVAFVRVGEDLRWPLMRDEQVVKLDPIHYVFSLPVVDATSTPEVPIA